MSRVSFYVLAVSEPRARLAYTCRLTEKVYKLGQRIHCVAEDETQAQALDELLWTFRQGSFVPHARVAAGAAASASPVTIGRPDEPAPEADVLINLAREVPACFDRFTRIAEIIDGDPACRSAGRERHRHYRRLGIQPETHEVE